ncbi:glycosyltransferase family 2 protein [Nocardioides mangrovicus]|uniref:glycosyltransferase family 2 protein n=1 Tax=Nocardioides mangrovicus TaxID=2478913 RepID=UPI0018E09756|nr:glycosyltransferase family 2 protein [Nocardioides mangrovicus]
MSVVVPHYGDPAPTLRLLDALRDQRGVDLQLVVVDDASPQPFPEPFPEPVPGQPGDTGVEVVRRRVNGGFGSAVNSGAARARQPWLLVLNSDVEVGPTLVSDLLRAAASWQPAVVSPRVVDRDGVEAWTGRRFPSTTQQAVEWLTPLARYRDRGWWHRAVGHDVGARGRTQVVDWVVGAAMLLPTEAFAAAGGFDERFHMNAEEVDLQRRLREQGVRAVALAEPTLVHVGGGSSHSTRRRGWLVDSRLRYAEKWGGRRRLQAALTAATGANLAVNACRRLAGRDLHPLGVAREELALIWGAGR